jgi:RimJ/RimL family protein N-acetyltransferase
MTAEPLLMVPYVWDQGDLTRNVKLLDHLVSHPQWIGNPNLSPEDLRLVHATILTDPRNRLFECWRGPEFVGVLYLTEIFPGVGATLHFTFLDAELRGKAKLLHQFIGRCFNEFGFHRLTMYIPEHVETLASYARRKLGFRFEGEPRDHPLYGKLGTENPSVWVARQGSRREKMHWDEKTGQWSDLIVLRLLKDEYVPMT